MTTESTTSYLMLASNAPEAVEFKKMPPDLDGYWWETETFICVPFVASQNPRAFLTFLRTIESTGKTIFFPTIINARLDRLLRLRGYQNAAIPEEQMGETVLGLAKVTVKEASHEEAR